jgi:hypothetical protein
LPGKDIWKLSLSIKPFKKGKTMKDDRGEPVFSGAAVDEILKADIIGHAKEHAQADPKKPEPEKKAEKICCSQKIDKKSIFKIVLLALAGIVTVACFLLVGNFYFVKKGKKKR